uniref:Uncharacterized protein n=1 Tax=Heliothis virescens TaxID=7102 RepID=A0A2A4JM85_HELVI
MDIWSNKIPDSLITKLTQRPGAMHLLQVCFRCSPRPWNNLHQSMYAVTPRRNGGGISFQQRVAANLKQPRNAVVRCIGTTRGHTTVRRPCSGRMGFQVNLLYRNVCAEPNTGILNTLHNTFSPRKKAWSVHYITIV